MTKLLVLAILGLLLPMVFCQDVETTEESNEHDLCRKMKCKKPRGSWCQVVDVDGVPTPKCVCPDNCDGEQEKPVCSVYGKQYDNKCMFHKYSCKKRKAIPLAFDTPCIAAQEPCTKEEFNQFPYRLLEWFMHLKEKNEFGRIDPSNRITYLEEEKREEVATWKFDSLDKNQDDILDKKELLRFRYALMPLEHCASPFFTRCGQKDGDVKRITMNEWMDCLKVYEVIAHEPVMPQDQQTPEDPQEPVVDEEEEEDDEELEDEEEV